MGTDDRELVARLRVGEEEAFVELVERYHTRLIGLARQFVAGPAAAEDVVQETWLAVFRGIERFEGRSSLRTWLFRICVNRARSHGVQDHRFVPIGSGEAAADPGWFGPDGRWATPPQHWAELVDDRLEATAVIDLVRAAIEALPGLQRVVVTLRDVEGLTGEEVRAVLSISEGNQRVLLHRGRSAVRRAIAAAIDR